VNTGRVAGSLFVPPLWAALADSTKVLVAGAGGGFDVYAGLPIAMALASRGKSVSLANLSFSDLIELSDDGADSGYDRTLGQRTFRFCPHPNRLSATKSTRFERRRSHQSSGLMLSTWPWMT
jgi:hypothetical protein